MTHFVLNYFGIIKMNNLLWSGVFGSILLFSGFSQAHSQMPTLYGGPPNVDQAVSFSRMVLVPIKLMNFSAKPTAYRLYSDGKYMSTTEQIHKGTVITHYVPVVLNKLNKPETHSVCSLSDTGVVKTKMCTKVQVIWIKYK